MQHTPMKAQQKCNTRRPKAQEIHGKRNNCASKVQRGVAHIVAVLEVVALLMHFQEKIGVGPAQKLGHDLLPLGGKEKKRGEERRGKRGKGKEEGGKAGGKEERRGRRLPLVKYHLIISIIFPLVRENEGVPFFGGVPRSLRLLKGANFLRSLFCICMTHRQNSL